MLDPELARMRSNLARSFTLGSFGGQEELPLELYYLLKSVRVFGYLERPLFLEICKFIETKHVPAGFYLFNKGDVSYAQKVGKLVIELSFSRAIKI